MPLYMVVWDPNLELKQDGSRPDYIAAHCWSHDCPIDEINKAVYAATRVPFACGVRRLKVPMTIGGDTPKANGTRRCLRRRDNRIRADTRQYRRHRGGFPKWREWKSLQARGSEALEGLAGVG